MGVEAFIARWTAREGGAERANYQMFLSELCDVLTVDRPEPAGAERSRNDYVFERAVESSLADLGGVRRIDLYKRGAFILEAKQSRQPGSGKALASQLPLLPEEPEVLGRRSTGRGWDLFMKNAFKQARDYVHDLPTDHPAPPFLIVADVGHCFEVYADFSGTGRGYSQFPDRQSFRVYMDDLRDGEVRERLARIWTDPASLDPTRELVRVTRSIANRLAQVGKALEDDHPPQEVAHFLMRCIFTMFAEDVELLPKGAFTQLLDDCIDSPAAFAPMLQDLWARMDDPDHDRRFYSAFRVHLRHFNGNLFKNARAFPLGREEIGELREAARHDWKEVDPAIFGTLLEQALDPTERRRLGAHYTPRAYVERLVGVTVMEPLWADWEAALRGAEDAMDSGRRDDAARRLKAFHAQLCATRVLDPACGTGNFLYVALEMMKRLEGEVLERLAELGESGSIGLTTVDPHQFLGLELNPRAAAIAELVVWIGYLQQHYRTHSGHPSEPILQAFRNINLGRRDGYDAVLTWDGCPLPTVAERDGRRVETYPNPRRPEWPEAEFIVGNPPFLGKGAAMRGPLGDAYVESLWAAHPEIDQSSDFVMYWWDRAASLCATPGSCLRRFGLVTTNSISGVFNRRTLSRHLGGKRPLRLVYAVPDHPWTKATHDSAAVRIAMTVADADVGDGTLQEVVFEQDLDTDTPSLELSKATGLINADLTVGVDVLAARPLLATSGMACNGMMLAGRGFVLSRQQTDFLLTAEPAAADIVRPYLNGAELVRSPRGRSVIDAFGWTEAQLRTDRPRIYQHLLETVRPERNQNRREAFRRRWWMFGEPRSTFRPALADLHRYIGTTETSKHRLFQFLPATAVPDHMIIAIALNDAEHLAVLSSTHHVVWATRTGGWLGVGNDPRYSKSRCFDPFPFPDPPEPVRLRLRALGEELDETRKRVLAEHPDLTLTGLYNVLEELKAGAPLSAADQDVKDRGCVLILMDLHRHIDVLVADAYGWPRDLAATQILERLVALNAERAIEEGAGHVRWLRADYQVPRFAKGAAARTGELALDDGPTATIGREAPLFPTDRYEQPLAVEAALVAAGRPMAPAELARGFRRGGRRIEQRTLQVLTTLSRYGRVTALPDGRYAARRAA